MCSWLFFNFPDDGFGSLCRGFESCLSSLFIWDLTSPGFYQFLLIKFWSGKWAWNDSKPITLERFHTLSSFLSEIDQARKCLKHRQKLPSLSTCKSTFVRSFCLRFPLEIWIHLWGFESFFSFSVFFTFWNIDSYPIHRRFKSFHWNWLLEFRF